MNTEVLLLGLLIIGGFVGLYVALRRANSAATQTTELEKVVNQVFGMSSAKIAEQSRQLLQSERETIHVDVAGKHKAIEELVRQLQLDLHQRQDELRTLEQDRTQKFSELSTHLQQQRQVTESLKLTTEQLAQVLSNNQQRGAWGERIIEDLLQANGLVEGVHYQRQTKLVSTELKPDITLLLPDHRVVAVDVKFPYSEMQKLAAAPSKAMQEAHLKQFGVDLKLKIEKVAQYINPEAQTLDYAILFVPNEMIFSFINQKFPALIDEALARRVILVSPFSFLIVARTVIESYRNFMISDKLRDVVKYVDEFVKEWGVFKDKFAKYGRTLDTLKTDFDEINGTRVRQMERRIEKIESVRQGAIASGE